MIIEAFVRFFSEPQIEAETMLVISILGLIINLIVAIYMHKSGDIKE